MLAVGFPAIISGQTVTNALKVGLVGCGGRGSGAAAPALAADANSELTAVADVDEDIVQQATTRLKGSERFGARVRIDRPYVGLDAYDKVINRGVDVVLLATPRIPAATPDGCGERKQARLLRKAVRDRLAGRAGGHGGAEAGADQEPRAGRWFLLALQQHDSGRRAASPERRHRPPGRALFDVLHQTREADAARERAPGQHEQHTWQIRNWYNFTWLCGDSLVEQAVHNADKIMWIMNDSRRRCGRRWWSLSSRPMAATSTTTSRSTTSIRMGIGSSWRTNGDRLL